MRIKAFEQKVKVSTRFDGVGSHHIILTLEDGTKIELADYQAQIISDLHYSANEADYIFENYDVTIEQAKEAGSRVAEKLDDFATEDFFREENQVVLETLEEMGLSTDERKLENE